MRRRSGNPLILVVLGVLLIIGGIVYGVSSKQVTYQKYKQGASGAIAHYLYDTGDDNQHRGYLEMENSQDLFIIHEQNFTPSIKQGDTFRDGDVISFIYDPATTSTIDVESSLSHLKGDASEVVEITMFDQNGGQTEFTSTSYRSNHQGYYKNNWPTGLGVLGFGVVLTLLSTFAFVRRRAAVAKLGTAMPLVPQQPYQPVANYNGQPQYGASPNQFPPQGGQPSWPGQYPPQQQGQPSQPGFYPPQQGQPSQPGFYPPQQGQAPYPGQQAGYPPQQQYPSQPGTQYPPYPPRQD